MKKKSQNKQKNNKNKARKEELFKPYMLTTPGEEAVLDADTEDPLMLVETLSGLKGAKAKKEMAAYERLIEGRIKNDIRDIIGMNDHPCAETDIDRLDEIERYIDTLKE